MTAPFGINQFRERAEHNREVRAALLSRVLELIDAHGKLHAPRVCELLWPTVEPSKRVRGYPRVRSMLRRLEERGELAGELQHGRRYFRRAVVPPA